MADDTADVKPGEGNTPSDSSSDAKPGTNSDAGASDEGAKSKAGSDAGERMIPYSQLKKARTSNQELKARIAELERNTSSDKSKGDSDKSDSSSDGDVDKRIDQLADALAKRGFVTKADQAATQRVAEAKDLASKHDGSDGLPKFDIDEVTNFMKERNMAGASYSDAYFLMNRDKVMAKMAQDMLTGNKGQVTTTGKPVFGESGKKDATSREGVASMPLEEYAKMGGSKALEKQIMAGQM